MSVRKFPVPVTDYKEPKDISTSLGLPSSIFNGTTSDGGMRSITYKSVYASQLIEELDMARRAVVAGDSPLTQICDKRFAVPEKVAGLQSEVAAFQTHADAVLSNKRERSASDEILQLNSELEQDLRSQNEVSRALSHRLRYGIGAASRGSNGTHVIKKMRVVSNVRTAYDVAGFDPSIYALATERRMAEETQKVAELEKAAAEAQAKKQAEADAEAQAQAQAKAQSANEQSANAFGSSAPAASLAATESDQMAILSAVSNQAFAQQSEAAAQMHQANNAQNQEYHQVNTHAPVHNAGHAGANVHEAELLLPDGLGELSYAMDNDVSMEPSYSDAYMQPQSNTSEFSPLPQMDSSYLQGPGPQ